MALDPICDKIFAAVLVIVLILYRDMPVWIAAAILGRDVFIFAGGIILRNKRDVIVPSNYTGKYAFAAVALLLGSYIIRFDYGIVLMTWVSMVLIVASAIMYFRIYLIVWGGDDPPPRMDNTWLRVVRFVLAAAILAFYFFRLYVDTLAG
jgi:phosphatidylglycerophosphate synthase